MADPALKARAAALALAWTLTPSQLADVELLTSGALAPLTGFMAQADYARSSSKPCSSAAHVLCSVLQHMRLAAGAFCPAPVVLRVDSAFASRVTLGAQVALRDSEGDQVRLIGQI
jgi:sulfate adenylyltransferase